MQAKSHLALVAPTGEKRAVPAGRRSNSDYRKREYLTPAEIEKLIAAAKGNRHGHRDATMILVAFRHGLRASEICELEWSDIDFAAAEMHAERGEMSDLQSAMRRNNDMPTEHQNRRLDGSIRANGAAE
jgi:type 1 fimbriae regulatory protein FimB/type 1 fimbriae regulatory protein FimE